MKVLQPQPLYTTEKRILTLDDLIKIRDHQNNFNRPLDIRKVNKLTRRIKTGLWRWEDPEGNTLWVDHTNGELVSAQHRIHSMINAEVDKWAVTIHYIDRVHWLAESVEKRSASDRISMNLSGAFDKYFSDAASNARTQYSNVKAGRASTSGANQLTTTEFTDKYGDVITEFWGVLPDVIKPSKSLAGALMVLHLVGLVGLDDVANILQPNSRLGSSYLWLTAIRGFGTKGNPNSAPYAVAVFAHALRTELGGNYLEIEDDYKPMYRSGHSTYRFDDYL